MSCAPAVSWPETTSQGAICATNWRNSFRRFGSSGSRAARAVAREAASGRRAPDVQRGDVAVADVFLADGLFGNRPQWEIGLDESVCHVLVVHFLKGSTIVDRCLRRRKLHIQSTIVIMENCSKAQLFGTELYVRQEKYKSVLIFHLDQLPA